MSNVTILNIEKGKRLHEFTMLPFKIYKNNPNWCPPLISEYKKYVCGVNNMLLDVGPHVKIIAQKNGETVGRLLIGIDEHLNAYRNMHTGYLSQFECINDFEVAKAMFDYAKDWLKERGMNRIKGPMSLPAGDDTRGMIIDNFDTPAFIMNIYNHKYYNDLFTQYGFQKYCDCYAYYADLRKIDVSRYQALIPKLMERFHFRLDKINLKEGLERDSADILKVLQNSLPDEWEDFMPITKGDVDMIVKQLAPFADPDLIFIARNDKDEPIGFNITIPNYNEILRKMKGRIFPFGFLKFLWYKKRLTSVRMLVLFVDPAYRSKGVAPAIYLQSHQNAIAKGFIHLEGSQVWEYNQFMAKDIEKFGAKQYITYRIYEYNM
ncbi:hypothetical protein [Treponema phagedenis]|uniref:hypothetical protein n=1 Tax=Treponema phagedenis TaxID=162 RepID=UPI00197D7F8F|nr:hypothetical protein [Treponema phagedenis]QSH95945.1 hypothetical protein C5O78_13160 [Treponema phagedenis]